MLHASHLARGAACVAIVLLPAPAPAPSVVQQQWVHLGSRAVGSGGDRDIIRTASAGQFKRIRLVVEGGDLELFDVSITFADGKSFSPTGRFSEPRASSGGSTSSTAPSRPAGGAKPSSTCTVAADPATIAFRAESILFIVSGCKPDRSGSPSR